MRKYIYISFLFLLFGSLVITSCSDSGTSMIEDITVMEDSLFNSEDASFDKDKAQALVDAYENFCSKYPKNEKCPEYLFRAGDLSKGLRQSNKALEFYQKVHKEYSDHEKAPLALFLQGFVYENDLGDYQNAKIIYEKFVDQYPDHHMAQDAEFSLKNLGKTPEQLLMEFQQKQDTI
ncbi:MAG: tetratricopeptide repeat protein [Bacteroidia bacterium]|nr:tetratricopeptide repeat protein [Bacteroidia bacterium]